MTSSGRSHNFADEGVDASLKKLVDSSGFPLQWAVEHQVNATTSQHGWRVESKEHAWKHFHLDKSGFIDIVLSHERSIYKVVIECKRPRNGQWIFLVGSDPKQETRLRTRWIAGPTPPLDGWYDFFIEPQSLESDVCIVRGQGENTPTMIERLSADLVDSIYALSQQEMQYRHREGYNAAIIYIPIIVTVARLMACRLDPSKISLSDGMSTDPEFEEVSMMRFCKSLTTELPPEAAPMDLQAENRQKERSVLIVNALSLVEALGKIALQKGRPQSLPWAGQIRI